MPHFYGKDRLWREVPGLMPDKLNGDMRVAYVMGALASDAVITARDVFGEKLDYTPESVDALERVLARLHDELPRGRMARLLRKAPSSAAAWEMALAWGAYLGELLRLHEGARWTPSHPRYLDDGYFMSCRGLNLAPVVKVYDRLTGGAGDNVAFYYHVFSTSMVPEALEEHSRLQMVGC